MTAKRFKKQVLLLTWSLLILAVFFALPHNRDWLFNTVGHYWNQFLFQKSRQDLEYRKMKRWETDYTYSRAIRDSLRKKGVAEHTLVLLPPTGYFAHHSISYHVPEPAVFYYYTGLKTIWANSPKADEASWYVRVHRGKILVDTPLSKQALRDTIQFFKKFGVHL